MKRFKRFIEDAIIEVKRVWVKIYLPLTYVDFENLEDTVKSNGYIVYFENKYPLDSSVSNAHWPTSPDSSVLIIDDSKNGVIRFIEKNKCLIESRFDLPKYSKVRLAMQHGDQLYDVKIFPNESCYYDFFKNYTCGEIFDGDEEDFTKTAYKGSNSSSYLMYLHIDIPERKST